MLCGVIAASWATHALGQNAPALANVSTRGTAGAGDNVMIAGFIIEGTVPHTVAIRVLGPSLTKYGLSGVLSDPVCTLNAGGTDIATNDDWRTDTASAAALHTANLDVIHGTAQGDAPISDREAALVRTLAPGNYTVIVRGNGAATGIALIEAYDLDITNPALPGSRLINLSTRGLIGGGENVMIMGFVIGGSTPRDILVTTIAGSLTEYHVSGVSTDPKVEIFSGSQKIAESDDWTDSPYFDTIARTGFCPRDPLESAVWLPQLAPGAYTAVVSGMNGKTGVALPEIYDVRQLGDVRFSPIAIGDSKAKLSLSTGAPSQMLDLAFVGDAGATVNAGASGSYVYSVNDDFRANLTVTASGYTLTGSLLFYRDGYAVFDGTLTAPGATAQKAGGILAFEKQP